MHTTTSIETITQVVASDPDAGKQDTADCQGSPSQDTIQSHKQGSVAITTGDSPRRESRITGLAFSHIINSGKYPRGKPNNAPIRV